MMSRYPALCAALLLVALLAIGAGCGGDDDGGGGSDEEEIRQVITDFATNEGAVCDLLTDRLVEEQFEGRDQCAQEAEESKDEEDPDGIEFGEITIEGEEATAQVDVGGDPSSVQLQQVDGDWKIDEIGPGESADSEAAPEAGTETVFVLEAVLGCLKAEGLDASRQSGLGDEEEESDHVRVDYSGGNTLIYFYPSADAAAEEEETQRIAAESLGGTVRRVGNTLINEDASAPAEVTTGIGNCVASEG